jgi:serine/threonine-protein kinase
MEAKLVTALGSRYELHGLLGRGGMGAVYRATDTTLERQVAIKVLPPEYALDETFVTRFEREARTAAKLDHPGIIPIYAVEHQHDLYYFVMKYVKGRGLDDLIPEGGMELEFAREILWESAVALGHAHARDVVHRDIKPANIMIDEEGRALITDFGISKATQAATQLTATGEVIGTPHYMSPEQAKGIAVDGRSDQYSLAMAAYHMLTGRIPFGGESLHTVIYKQVFEDPPPLRDIRADVPDALAAAIHRALRKEPDERFPTMEEFASALHPERPVRATGGAMGLASGVTSKITATPTTPRVSGFAQPAPTKRRSTALVAAAAVVLIGGGAAGGLWLASQGGDAQTAGTEPAAVAMDGPESSSETQPMEIGDSARAEQQGPGAANETDETSVPAPRESPPSLQPQPAPAQVTPSAPPPGLLTINADPFGSVYVDGVPIGDTPVVRHELLPGRHIVEVRREGYVTVVDTLDVVSGNPYRLQKTLLRQG